MTRSQPPRAHDLLADRALVGLDDAEAGELQELGADGDESYDLAAAAADLATLRIEPMPAAVAERVLAARHPRTLVGWVMPPPQLTAVPEPAAAPLGAPAHAAMAWQPAPPPAASAAPLARRRGRPVVWLAAAATVVIAVGAWWLLRGRAAPTLAEARAELLATADATRLDWKATPEAANASGDIVWSRSAQRGVMRFVGLSPNDPRKTQYQLWIFDRQRDQAFPVDGGVFDVTSTGEVLVPITAKLRVDDATLFAVTVEQSGGVVVSKREHIVVTAARS
jgi:hypothetical protein